MAKGENLLDQVEAALRQLLLRGLPLSGAVERFLNATWGVEGLAGLQAILKVADDAERDSLLELVFFPDRTFQATLEETLDGGGLVPEAVVQLKSRLVDYPPVACLTDSDGQIVGQLALLASGVAAFVDRMNLTWRAAPELRREIRALDTKKSQPPGEIACRLLVGLRNAELQQTAGQVRLLTDYLACVPAEDARFQEGFDFLMAFLPDHAQAENLYLALMARKRFLFRHLTQARRNAARFQQHNMETLNQAGLRVAHFDIPEAERIMDLIDLVAVTVFGKTDPLADHPVETDLGQADTSGVRLFRLLS